MPTFQSKKFRSSTESNSFGAKYRSMMAKRPFLLFGLPFLTVIVAGSFVLTPAAAIRYERHDRKVRTMTREEELGVSANKRRVDIREEYYVSFFFFFSDYNSIFMSIPNFFFNYIANDEILETEIGSKGSG